jgi:hypothetical protein
MLRIRLDRVRLPVPIGVDESGGHEVRVRHRVGVGNGERVFEDRLDRPPDLIETS